MRIPRYGAYWRASGLWAIKKWHLRIALGAALGFGAAVPLLYWDWMPGKVILGGAMAMAGMYLWLTTDPSSP